MSSISSLPSKKLIERAENIERAKVDLGFRAALVELAKRDVLFYFNQFLWTYDPRPEKKPNHFPFLTWDYQDDYIVNELEQAYLENRDILTDKSRDMGATWMVLGWIQWHWNFDPAFNALLGSRKEDLVDSLEEPDTLFEKIAYNLKRMPWWLLPRGFSFKDHRNFLHILNPESGNTIKGESANSEFSRQGRYSVIMLDEFAFWPHADAAWTATGDASPIRIPISTPHGMNNKFADLRFSKQIRTKSLHWTLHPEKDQAWYETQKARRTPKEVAQELDIDYEASGSERVFDLKTDKDLRSQVIIDPFEVPRTWKFRAGLDYGTRNKSSFHIYAMDYNATHYAIFEWRRNMEDLKKDEFRGSMVQAIAQMIFECPFLDLIDHCRADPSLWVKNQNSPDGMTSIIQQIQDELTRLNKERLRADLPKKQLFGFSEGAQNDLAAIQVVRTLWSDPKDPAFKIFRTCTGLINELDELMWEEWSESQKEKRNEREQIMDRNNHSWDDLKYYIMSRHTGPVEKKEKPGHGTYGWLMEQERKQRSQDAGRKLRS